MWQKAFVALWLILCGAAAASVADHPVDQALAAASAPKEMWLTWQVPTDPDFGYICCLDGFAERSGAAEPRGTCRLDRQDQGWSTSRGRLGEAELEIRVKVARGKVQRVSALSRSCPVELEAPVRPLAVTPQQSLDFLRRQALSRAQNPGPEADRPVVSQLMAAIGLHSAPESLATLVALMETAGASASMREEAIFWIGQTQGHPGVEVLTRTFGAETDPDVREKILFSLSQTTDTTAFAFIANAMVHDRNPEVRGQACFWLAETAAPQRLAQIQNAIAQDPAAKTRKACVFALSQIEGQATPALIDLARNSKDHGVRREALFWLGQSQDPRALDTLAELLRP